jgi:pyrimidine operon attenuation protein / uracil phosphoribosyltransferase
MVRSIEQAAHKLSAQTIINDKDIQRPTGNSANLQDGHLSLADKIDNCFFLAPSQSFMNTPANSQIVEILSPEEMRRTIKRMAAEIVESCRDLSQVVLVGVHTRGVPLAKALSQQIAELEGVDLSVSTIDITFYRDDLQSNKVRTPVRSQIDVDINGKTIVLIDDVIYKGRTARASLNALAEYGRPDRILLAVLVDRGHRQLPIQPDFVGKRLPTSHEEQVRVYFQDTDGRDTVELVR